MGSERLMGMHGEGDGYYGTCSNAFVPFFVPLLFSSVLFHSLFIIHVLLTNGGGVPALCWKRGGLVSIIMKIGFSVLFFCYFSPFLDEWARECAWEYETQVQSSLPMTIFGSNVSWLHVVCLVLGLLVWDVLVSSIPPTVIGPRNLLG